MTSLTPELTKLIRLARSMANIPLPNIHPSDKDARIQDAINTAWKIAWTTYSDTIIKGLGEIQATPENLKAFLTKVINLSPPPCPFNPPDAMEYQAVLNAWRSGWGNYRLTIKRMLGGHG